MNTDYLVERRLKKLNPKYHQLVAASTTAIIYVLERYKNYFPQYTDHSIAHSLNVLDFVNRLIGTENIEKLNADELYILVMGAYLHDTGMGISERDFELAKGNVIPYEYLEAHPGEEAQNTIRKFHHELSAFFVEKYQGLFEIPSEKHAFAIAAASKGHRVADLYDDSAFPREMLLDNGNTVCVPYLSALIRLADEMDIAEDRIFAFDFPETDTINKKIHHAIKRLEVTGEAFEYYVSCEDELWPETVNTINKMEKTFKECKKLIEDRTEFSLSQKSVNIIRMD